MRSLVMLVRGEFQRLIRYKLLQVGFAISVLWVLVMFLIGRDEAGAFVPFFVFIDASLMTVILIGSGLFYERQENTIKSLLITPSSMGEIIVSKLVSAIYIALQSALFLSVVSIIFFSVGVNVGLLMLVVILAALAHAMIGYTFAVLVKDFPTLLSLTMIYTLVFAFPSIMYALGVLGEPLNTVLLVSPTHASMLLIDWAFGENVAPWLLVGGAAYLLILSVILGVFVVFPKYLEKAIGE